MPDEHPRIMRCPVEIEGGFHEVKPAPPGAKFDSSEASTKIMIDKVLVGRTLHETEGGATVKVRALGLHDPFGALISIGLEVRDSDGDLRDNITLSLAEEDAKAIVKALGSLIELAKDQL